MHAIKVFGLSANPDVRYKLLQREDGLFQVIKEIQEQNGPGPYWTHGSASGLFASSDDAEGYLLGIESNAMTDE